MKPAGRFLLLPLGLVAITLSAQTSSERVTRETTARIREGLPTFQPPPPPSDGNSTDDGPQTNDPDVLILPKFMVKEKRLPHDAADHLMSRRDFKRKMENIYLDTLAADGPLNVLLNNFTIPILSPSKAARGRAIYQAREIDRLRRITDLSNTLNPEAALDLKRELDNSHTTRPAGGLQKR